MTTTTKTIQERVAAGATALDRELPDWADRVDLDSLSMNHGCRCILGQTFGNYFDAPFGDEHDRPDRYRADLGFQSYIVADDLHLASDPDGPALRDAEYADLQAEWISVIEARRAEAGAR